MSHTSSTAPTVERIDDNADLPEGLNKQTPIYNYRGSVGKMQLFRVSDGVNVDSIHIGKGLTLERVAEEFQSLWSNNGGDPDGHDLAVFLDDRIVGILRIHGVVVTLIRAGAVSANPSEAEVSEPAPQHSEGRDDLPSAWFRETVERFHQAEEQYEHFSRLCRKELGTMLPSDPGWDRLKSVINAAKNARAEASNLLSTAVQLYAPGETLERLNTLAQDWPIRGVIHQGRVYISAMGDLESGGDATLLVMDETELRRAE